LDNLILFREVFSPICSKAVPLFFCENKSCHEIRSNQPAENASGIPTTSSFPKRIRAEKYANQVFTHVSQYSEQELLGAPHNLVRHPQMPRVVFKLLWDTISAGKEIFAYVNNLAKNGDNYWVFAHVTPTFDEQGKIISYHSSRRVPRREAVDRIAPIYQLLCREESRHTDSKSAMEASGAILTSQLKSLNKSYGEFVFSV
jgi:hypothetical protein